jgi:hypothetical protein
MSPPHQLTTSSTPSLPTHQVLIDSLKKYNHACRLKYLNLSSCNVNVAGSEVLSLALTQNRTLEELVLSGPRNYIGTAGSCVIASALLENKTLKNLWLDRNKI